jgi:arylsulfatase A-like enzyme
VDCAFIGSKVKLVVDSPKLGRRTFLGGLAATTALRGAAVRKPNFLFLLADDHAGYVLGCDGNRLAPTPNLDELAREGTRFTRHYCNSPVCTPSRQSFLTGQLPHMAGVTRLPTPLSLDKPTLAQQFRVAGYGTAVFGKMHLNRPAAPGLFGFDVMLTENEIRTAWLKEVKPRPIPPAVHTKPAWKPFQDPARIWLNAGKLPYPRIEAEMLGTYIADSAVRHLEQNAAKPFAMWVSFMEPHSPFDFPVEYKDRLDSRRFEVPRVGPQDGGQIPIIFRDLNDEEKRGINAAYYTSVSFLDRNIGRVLAGLRRLNLEDDTFVVYMADHGYNLGHHGRFEKHCGYDQAMRVPLLMRYPGRIRRGAVHDFTEHIDVPATIVDVMNLDPLPVQHGQTLRPYLEGRKIDRSRDHIFTEYLENEEAYIRSARWKYIFCSGRRARTDGYLVDNPTPGRYRRLYDLASDPGEFSDVAPKNAAVVASMEDLMLKRFRATHPDAAGEPQRLSPAEAIEFYLRPRDV